VLCVRGRCKGPVQVQPQFYPPNHPITLRVGGNPDSGAPHGPWCCRCCDASVSVCVSVSVSSVSVSSVSVSLLSLCCLSLLSLYCLSAISLLRLCCLCCLFAVSMLSVSLLPLPPTCLSTVPSVSLHASYENLSSESKAEEKNPVSFLTHAALRDDARLRGSRGCRASGKCCGCFRGERSCR